MNQPKTVRKSHEFKSKILAEIEETKNVALVARTYDLNYQTVSSWVRACRDQPKRNAATELKDSRAIIEKLQMEVRALEELLKKTNQAWLTDLV